MVDHHQLRQSGRKGAPLELATHRGTHTCALLLKRFKHQDISFVSLEATWGIRISSLVSTDTSSSSNTGSTFQLNNCRWATAKWVHPDTAWSGIPCCSVQSATQASLRMHSAARCSSAVGRNRKWLQLRMLGICSEMGRHVMGRYQQKPRLRNL